MRFWGWQKAGGEWKGWWCRKKFKLWSSRMKCKIFAWEYGQPIINNLIGMVEWEIIFWSKECRAQKDARIAITPFILLRSSHRNREHYLLEAARLTMTLSHYSHLEKGDNFPRDHWYWLIGWKHLAHHNKVRHRYWRLPRHKVGREKRCSSKMGRRCSSSRFEGFRSRYTNLRSQKKNKWSMTLRFPFGLAR